MSHSIGDLYKKINNITKSIISLDIIRLMKKYFI